jgi:hypothetical protein
MPKLLIIFNRLNIQKSLCVQLFEFFSNMQNMTIFIRILHKEEADLLR